MDWWKETLQEQDISSIDRFWLAFIIQGVECQSTVYVTNPSPRSTANGFMSPDEFVYHEIPNLAQSGNFSGCISPEAESKK
jgi:hypothetical protein